MVPEPKWLSRFPSQFSKTEAPRWTATAKNKAPSSLQLWKEGFFLGETRPPYFSSCPCYLILRLSQGGGTESLLGLAPLESGSSTGLRPVHKAWPFHTKRGKSRSCQVTNAHLTPTVGVSLSKKFTSFHPQIQSPGPGLCLWNKQSVKPTAPDLLLKELTSFETVWRALSRTEREQWRF